jgi:hypothetical protein
MVHKLNIFPPSTICHAKVFSKGLPEAGSATTSVRKTRDLEWEAENDVEKNSVTRNRRFVIHQISKLGRRGGGEGPTILKREKQDDIRVFSRAYLLARSGTEPPPHTSVRWLYLRDLNLRNIYTESG